MLMVRLKRILEAIVFGLIFLVLLALSFLNELDSWARYRRALHADESCNC